jgi:hypothetical protein
MIRAVTLAIAGVLLGGAAHAQAICSAPHSSPVLAQGGTIRTLPPGSGWVQVSAFRQASDEFFGPAGDRQPFLADGRTRTHSMYVTGAAGVLPGLDVWLQGAVHDLRFRDLSGERHRLGLGDARASLRVGSELVGASLPLALRGGIKFPGTAFPVDATIIPLSEGQRDWELSVESGRAFTWGGTQTYVLGWIGYRWREQNDDAQRDPGDEIFTHLAVGAGWGSLRLDLGVEALFGRTPRQLGFSLPSSRRRLVQVQPTLGHGLGPGTVEVTILQPLVGRSLPTGTAASVGYRVAWGAP